jgi:putative ABC transport system permease protein
MTASVPNLEPLVSETQQTAPGEMLAPLDADTGAGFNLAEVVRVSLDSLFANKTRSFLTMLGVIIGVASVVALLSLGNGASATITGEVQSIGTNLIFVLPGNVNPRRPGATSAAQNLTMEDFQAISGLGLPLNGTSPQFSGNTDIVAPAADKNATIIGTTPAHFALQDLRTTSGSLFDENQSRAAAPVAVLGATLAKDLFGNGAAVGQTVRVKDQTLRVVGVLAAKGGGGMSSADDQLYAPISFVQQRLFGARTPDGNSYRVSNIMLSARNGDDITAIQDRLTVLLRERHHLNSNGNGDDFSVMNQASMLGTLNSITSILTAFLAAIAGISLLVGGIGIMNIMLVSVTERTKEIGLRKAVGARGKDILLQFIVEALVVSVTGGVIGLVFGMLIAGLVTLSGVLTATVSLSSVVLAVGFSLAVGLFFGIYPARRAARLNPIDALRYE